MKLPFIDILPRIKRMVDHPEIVDHSVAYSVGSGLIEGLVLFFLLPTTTALATHTTAWGLTICNWLWMFGGLAVLATIFNYFSMYHWYDVAMDFLVNIHHRIGDQVSRLPLNWFHSDRAGSLSRLVSSNLMTTGQIIAHMMGDLIDKLATIIVVLVCSWFWKWQLGLALLLTISIFVILVLTSTLQMRRAKKISEGPDIELSSRIIEYAQCQGTLRSTGQGEKFEPLTSVISKNYHSKIRAMWLESSGIAIGGVMNQVVVVSMIVVTAFLAISGVLAPIPAIAFIGLSLRFTTLLSDVSDSVMGLENSRPLLNTIDEVLTAKTLPEPHNSVPLTLPGTINFDKVTFNYNRSQPVLENISFSIAANTMVALVGPSGSGKTTIMRLIERFYDINKGTVSVSGADVRQLTTATLMKQLSMVFQDVYLFDDTLEANIRVGSPNASSKEIEHVADLAGVNEIALRLPKGLASSVGEGGHALSGGERQRVSIARALLKKAPIVLFDEATSALDTENEEHVVKSINELRKTATIFVIAHKLNTIKSADKIIVLTKDGQIEGTGTHVQLLKSSNTYRHFWKTHEHAQGWKLK